MLHIYEEAARCLLCKDAPCTKACSNGDPARAIRAMRVVMATLHELFVPLGFITPRMCGAGLKTALMPTWNVPSRLAYTTTSPYASGSC